MEVEAFKGDKIKTVNDLSGTLQCFKFDHGNYNIKISFSVEDKPSPPFEKGMLKLHTTPPTESGIADFDGPIYGVNVNPDEFEILAFVENPLLCRHFRLQLFGHLDGSCANYRSGYIALLNTNGEELASVDVGNLDIHSGDIECSSGSGTGSPNTGCITGTQNNDNLVGTSRADCIHGEGGNDKIAGLAGADLLIGNDGIDLISGGNGNDVLTGGQGADRLTLISLT